MDLTTTVTPAPPRPPPNILRQLMSLLFITHHVLAKTLSQIGFTLVRFLIHLQAFPLNLVICWSLVILIFIEDPVAHRFLDIIGSFGLQLHVKGPTHVAGHTLDLVITLENINLLHGSLDAHYMMTPHSMVLFTLNLPKPAFLTVIKTCRKIKSIDISKFRQDIQSCPLLRYLSKCLKELVRQY